jgi:Fe-S cluster assembly protein SufD
LGSARAAGPPAAATLELPSFKGRPGWEFTDISGLDLAAYEPAREQDTAAPERADAAGVQPLFTAQSGGELPEGVIVAPIARAAAEHAELIACHLGAVVSADDVFTLLNESAEYRSGAFVYVPRGVTVPSPIELRTVQGRAGTLLHQRTLIVLEAGARAEVWEQYLSGEAELDGVFNAVTELVVGDGARLRYVCGQALSERTWIFGAQRAEVGRDGSLDWVALGFGSANGRVRMETKLAGEGAEARVTGAYAPHNRQHIDFDTSQEHAAANTTSDLAFRGVLGGRSSAVWKGNIVVDPGAQKTDAFQESRNLLLSKRAHADAIPGLEIQANDVRCTHAAAVAQVDPEQLFYLRSRGLREEVAKRLVVEGFLAALVERFEEGPVRDRLGAALERRLAVVLGESRPERYSA